MGDKTARKKGKAAPLVQSKGVTKFMGDADIRLKNPLEQHRAAGRGGVSTRSQTSKPEASAKAAPKKKVPKEDQVSEQSAPKEQTSKKASASSDSVARDDAEDSDMAEASPVPVSHHSGEEQRAGEDHVGHPPIREAWKEAGHPSCPECEVVGLAGKHWGACDPGRREQALKNKLAKNEAKEARRSDAEAKKAQQSAKAGKEAPEAEQSDVSELKAKKQKTKRTPCGNCQAWSHETKDCAARFCANCRTKHLPRANCPSQLTGEFYSSSSTRAQPLDKRISNLSTAIANAATPEEAAAYQAVVQGLMRQQQARKRSASPRRDRGHQSERRRDRRRGSDQERVSAAENPARTNPRSKPGQKPPQRQIHTSSRVSGRCWGRMAIQPEPR
ncbi:hypothetical protein LTR37_017705 [Vermiconidia calcicola]|uniref:Uncharacterized protein n=1 Tax=Vermiconidia calcicola TaxID=1690605 RepID=A0ACC3MKE6_9PEZI|nr:hypothetical protein LTR37_017705 [Vermiconidia calcicola]